MLDIYTREGFLDRAKILDRIDLILGKLPTSVNKDAARQDFTNLLDEAAEAFTSNPLDAPTMTSDYIKACAREGQRHPQPSPRIAAITPLGQRYNERPLDMDGPVL